MTKNRLEAFSDGVLAIAITLLVIEIRPPELHQGESLAHALWAQWPSYVAYLVSFLTIGVIWLNHHRVFEQVARVDGPLLLLNLNLLLWTGLIPFPTAVVAEHLGGAGEAAQTASALYSGVLLLMGLSFGALFAWVTHTDRLLGRLPPPGVVRAARQRFMLGLVVYAAAFALSWCRRHLPWRCAGPWPCTTPSTRRRYPLGWTQITNSPTDGRFRGPWRVRDVGGGWGVPGPGCRS